MGQYKPGDFAYNFQTNRHFGDKQPMHQNVQTISADYNVTETLMTRPQGRDSPP
jgi:hypothetical protein